MTNTVQAWLHDFELEAAGRKTSVGVSDVPQVAIKSLGFNNPETEIVQ